MNHAYKRITVVLVAVFLSSTACGAWYNELDIKAIFTHKGGATSLVIEGHIKCGGVNKNTFYMGNPNTHPEAVDRMLSIALSAFYSDTKVDLQIDDVQCTEGWPYLDRIAIDKD